MFKHQAKGVEFRSMEPCLRSGSVLCGSKEIEEVFHLAARGLNAPASSHPIPSLINTIIDMRRPTNVCSIISKICRPNCTKKESLVQIGKREV